MDKVFETLKPDRGLVLLRSRASGELVPAVVRVAEGISAEDIRLSKTLVAAVVEKRNGLLLMDTSSGSGRLARRLDPPVGHQVGARGAPRERGRGRRPDLRRLPRRPPLVRGGRPAPSDFARQRRRRQDPERAPHAENAEKRQMDREFALAREIQQRLLPKTRRLCRATSSTGPTSRRARSPATISTSACAPTARCTPRSPTSAARAWAGAADGFAPGVVPRLGGRGRRRRPR